MNKKLILCINKYNHTINLVTTQLTQLKVITKKVVIDQHRSKVTHIFHHLNVFHSKISPKRQGSTLTGPVNFHSFDHNNIHDYKTDFNSSRTWRYENCTPMKEMITDLLFNEIKTVKNG